MAKFNFGDLVRVIDTKNEIFNTEPMNIFVVQRDAYSLCRIASENYSYVIERKYLELVSRHPQYAWIGAEDPEDVYEDQAEVIVQTESGDVTVSEVFKENGKMFFKCEEDGYAKVVYWQPLPQAKED
ncbi:hypothetical protein PL75_03430 [Neisseria arctica]|uniref:DUF551 domain-containing protein n=1 Tax=Neisseria arctica TaxID=1470200 RepID=A0A0J0YT09_9NEIS|nr:hypothetical protein [Neisseria arctica]KLT73285.1 hypothetical protein PL75_03430 [Neisseria arctica]UOO87453.1 hypothetical protein LVJ86_04210 [Neisseria arctica]